MLIGGVYADALLRPRTPKECLRRRELERGWTEWSRRALEHFVLYGEGTPPAAAERHFLKER